MMTEGQQIEPAIGIKNLLRILNFNLDVESADLSEEQKENLIINFDGDLNPIPPKGNKFK